MTSALHRTRGARCHIAPSPSRNWHGWVCQLALRLPMCLAAFTEICGQPSNLLFDHLGALDALHWNWHESPIPFWVLMSVYSRCAHLLSDFHKLESSSLSLHVQYKRNIFQSCHVNVNEDESHLYLDVSFKSKRTFFKLCLNFHINFYWNALYNII